MSGGSLNYVYRPVQNVAEDLMVSNNILHRAFGKHLFEVSKALFNIEWVLSGDYGEGDDTEAIKVVLGDNWKNIVIINAIEQMDEIRDSVIKLLEDTRIA